MNPIAERRTLGTSQRPSTTDLRAVPEGRTSANGKELDSLADRLPHQLERGSSFIAALKSEEGLQLKTTSFDAPYGAIQELICRLDEEDDPRQSDPEIRDVDVCGDAAQLLLECGQPRLLLRLAQKKSMPYRLCVDHEKRWAMVLKQIGSAWPKSVPVCIDLDLDLDGRSVCALRAFLAKPESLDVRLHGSGGDGASAAPSLHWALQQRNVNLLALVGNEFCLADLEALKGVAAHVIDLSDLEFDVKDRQREADALVALVSASDAKELRFGCICSSADLALHVQLLTSRTWWERVAILDPYLLDALPTPTPCQVRQLDWAFRDDLGLGLDVTASRFLALCKLGVRRLEFLNPVNPLRIIDAMEDCVGEAHGAAFPQTIRGHFRMRADARSIQRLLSSHQYDRKCESLVHKPSSAFDRFNATVPALDADTIAALNAINGFQVVEGAAERAAEVERVWAQAVQDIGGLLASDQPLSALMAYLRAPQPWVLRAVGVVSDAYETVAPLTAKLVHLAPSGLRPDKLREALEQGLRTDRTLLAELPRALFDSGWMVRNPNPSEWLGLRDGHQFKPFVQRTVLPRATDALPFLPARSNPGPGPSERVVRGFDVQSMIVPVGARTVQQTLVGYAEWIDRQREQNPAPQHQAVMEVLASIFKTGTVPTALLKNALVAREVFGYLRNMLQGGLARHIIAGAPEWTLSMFKPEHSTVLQALTPWPDPTSTCRLLVRTSSGASVIAAVRRLALTVPPAQLGLVLHVDSAADGGFWAQWEALIGERTGASLNLEMNARFTPTAQDWSAVQSVFAAVEKHEIAHEVPERELALSGWVDVPEAVALAVLGAVDRGGFSRLSVHQVHQAFAQRLMSTRGWNRLWIEPSGDTVSCFQGGDVHAHTLRFNVQKERTWRNVTAIVKACKRLKAIEFDGGAVNILQLAALLRNTHPLTSVTCDLEANSRKEIQAAKLLLEGNRRVTTFVQANGIYPKGGPAELVGEDDWDWLHGLANGNRLLSPEPIVRGLVRGMALAENSDFKLTVDVAGHVGGYVDDLKTALNLMRTSKGMYVGARHAIEASIDWLADLLAPELGFDQYTATMNLHFHRDWVPSASPSAVHLLGAKVLDMLALGLPQNAVEQVVGRRLASRMALPEAGQGNAALEHEQWQLLRCLAALGLIEPEEWLEKGLGIRVPPLAAQKAVQGTQ